MIYLLGLAIIFFAFFVGREVLVLFGGKSGKSPFGWEDCLVMGWMTGIGLAEAAHLVALVGGRSFSEAKILFLILLGMVVLIALVLRIRERTEPARRFSVLRENEDFSRKWGRITAYFLLLIVVLMAVHMVMEPALYRRGDLTVEQVNTLLSTNRLSGINPLTGRAYTVGTPKRLQILCLPTLYGFLSAASGLEASRVVWKMIPVCTILFTVASYSALGNALYYGEKRNHRAVAEKRLFLVLSMVLMLAGSYAFSVEGFDLRFAGWQGVVLRNCVLLPYLLSVLLRKKWVQVAFCLLTEACITWTLYGCGVGVLVTGIFLLVELLGKKYSQSSEKEVGV